MTTMTTLACSVYVAVYIFKAPEGAVNSQLFSFREHADVGWIEQQRVEHSKQPRQKVIS